MRTLIRGAAVVFADKVAESNILIDGGKIAAIDASPTTSADLVIEGKGLTLLPGWWTIKFIFVNRE